MKALIDYTLQLADSALIMAQRNAEWCGHGPVLEQDIAITNISLDLLGQSRNFYQYAASLTGGSATEDTLACLRTEREFKNCLLAELPNGDWAQTVLRLFFFSAYQQLLFGKLQQSLDETLASIAVKSLKEVNYHTRWSSEWVVRLGDGTEESHRRIVTALEELWPYTGEMFMTASYEEECIKNEIAPDPAALKAAWLEIVGAVFDKATIRLPEQVFMHPGGKEGMHTEHLGYILTELQYMQRAFPHAQW